MKQLVVLGATGSVGRATLDVAGQHPDRVRVLALTAHTDVTAMAALCQKHRPRYAVMADAAAAQALTDALGDRSVEVLSGMDGVSVMAVLPEATDVMSAIVGAIGLRPTLAAVSAGKKVMIANKEPLVMAGPMIMAAARSSGAVILPIDSEHNALFQCLPPGYRCGTPPPGVAHLTLTASGGPFRDWSASALASVTPAQAIKHPNWVMGRKISVDSASMMNKGLELIEAAALFSVGAGQLRVLVHPQSTLHSMVTYVDGSTLAQLGSPDMRIPIAHALAWPERWAVDVPPLDLLALSRLDFEAPDRKRFPCLALAEAALEQGGVAPLVLNAANEIAVEAFLSGRLPFMGIPAVISEMLETVAPAEVAGLEAVMAFDAAVRERATVCVRNRSGE
ncbi:1-deoxy-D-xylulose-5-phosphate reductoisomerase [Polycyclovorans algicola]|uniref:1-deoxy-D-xylulose-5-phosphate reductoisomerase n=1 Tax=Polycyclovorans algicola TaxID=616992 RepID=UPI0004A773D7|nr:1-deoxy-D-xylulose-5-phosphate reductoisomerase [Polycyclovorans algicola]